MPDPVRPELCGALKPTHVFSHHAYGDPLPVYARYFDSDGNTVEIRDAAVVYVRCSRECGHPGVHLAHGWKPWKDGDAGDDDA